MVAHFLRAWWSDLFASRWQGLGKVATHRNRKSAARSPHRGLAGSRRWRGLFLDPLEERSLLAAVPTVALSAPPDPLIGETATIEVSFDNTSATDVGFGPYVDLFLPVNGKDGLTPGCAPDGVRFDPNVNTAKYKGINLTAATVTLGSSGAIHPYAKDSSGNALAIPLPAGFSAGDQLVVVLLPFGSFAPEQPEATIEVTVEVSDLADTDCPNNALPITACGGFRFGNDPLDNPTLDPSLTPFATDLAAQQGNCVTETTMPALYRLTKTYLGPEQETAVGKNFTQQYRITIDVAKGQTVDNLSVTDVLPTNFQFVALDSIGGNGTTNTSLSPSSTPSTTITGGTLTRTFNKVIGTAAHTHGVPPGDAHLTFTFFVPCSDTDGEPVLDPSTGDDVAITNTATATGKWLPVDPCDTLNGQIDVVPCQPATDTIVAKSIAIQKTLANLSNPGLEVDPQLTGALPGDTIEYTLNFQISDCFCFDSITVADIFSDGQILDPGFAPFLFVQENFTSSSGSFSAGNFTATTAGTGETTLDFLVSSQLVDFGRASKMCGGCVLDGPPDNDGPTFGQIIFRTIIQDTYAASVAPPHSQSVDQGDCLPNDVTIRGEILDAAMMPQSPQQFEDDDSHALVVVPHGTLRKTIAAIEHAGVTTLNPPPTAKVAPGDLVTYRLEFDMPASSTDNLTFCDYLPLPIFDVTGFSTTFNTGGGIPAANMATWGPSDTFHLLSGAGSLPTISKNIANNRLEFTYGPFNDPSNTFTHIEVLFTVTVTNTPFADGLFLTNLLQVKEDTTNCGLYTDEQIVQVQIQEPLLNIRKGVFDTDSPDEVFSPGTTLPPGVSMPPTPTNPVTSANLPGTLNSNVSGVDAGDLVKFVIVVENTGSAPEGAFDVLIKDTLPAGFVIPSGGLNFTVTDGTGAVIAFAGTPNDLFGTGIELLDPGPTNTPTGALDPGKDSAGNAINTGRNIAIITYCLQVASDVATCQVIVNTASVCNYANVEGGPNFVPAGIHDPATVTIACTLEKSIVATSEAHTGFSGGFEQVAIGEIVRYRLVSRLAEGTSPNFEFLDHLPAGMMFLNDGTARLALVSNVVPISSAFGSGPFGTGPFVSGSAPPTPLTLPFALPSTAILGGPFNSGTDPIFNLGTLVNNDNDADKEWVVIEFNALVDNSGTNPGNSNDAGDKLDNTYIIRLDGGQVGPVSNTVTVCVVEPQMVNAGKIALVTSGDAGDAIPYVISFTADSGPNNTTAFDVRVKDPLFNPTFVMLDTGSVQVKRNGLPLTSGFTNNSTATMVDVTIDRVDPGDTIDICYNVILKSAVTPGQFLPNMATICWTSLPGPFGTTPNPTGSTTPGASGTTNGERNGDGGINDYCIDVLCSTVRVSVPTITKTIVATSLPSTGSNQHNPNITDLAINEKVTYQVSIVLPEGTTPNATLTDLLPKGLAGCLQYVSSTVVSIGSKITGSLLGVGQAGVSSDTDGDFLDDKVVFSFGTLNVGQNGTSADRTITVQIVACVVKKPGNFAGRVLTNQAKLFYGLGTIAATVDAEVVTASIHGQKYEDIDGNGQRDPMESGLSGWFIIVCDQAGNIVCETQTMDMDLDGDMIINPSERGLYWCDCLPPGTYTVKEVLQPGWGQSQPAAGMYEVTLNSGDELFGFDFGNYRTVSIHGQKFNDLNFNGLHDEFDLFLLEPGLNGWTIEIYNIAGALVCTTQTMSMDLNGDSFIDAGTEVGLYWCDDLPPGEYTVVEVMQPGWAQTAPVSGSYTVNLLSGDTATGLDFGNFNECPPPPPCPEPPVCLEPPPCPVPEPCPPQPGPISVPACPQRPPFPRPLTGVSVAVVSGAVEVLGAIGTTASISVVAVSATNYKIMNGSSNLGTYNLPLFIDLGAFADMVTVMAAPGMSFNVPITISTGGGNDSVLFTVAGTGSGPVTFNREVCIDMGDFNDTVSINGVAGSAIEFKGAVLGGTPPDTYSLAIHGGNGTDTVAIGTTGPVAVDNSLGATGVNNFTLGNFGVVNGNLTIDNRSEVIGANQMLLDTGSVVNGNFTYSGTSFFVNDVLTLRGAIGASAVIDAGNGANMLTFGPTATIGVDLYYRGGLGLDTVNMSTVNITGGAVLRMGDGNNSYQMGQVFRVGAFMCMEGGNGTDFISPFRGMVFGPVTFNAGGGTTNGFILASQVFGLTYVGSNAGTDIIDLGGNSIVGNVNLLMGNGTNIYQLGGGFNVYGDMYVCAGITPDTINPFNGIVRGSLIVDLGQNTNSLIFAPTAIIWGHTFYTGGTLGDTVNLSSANFGFLGGSVILRLGPGTNSVLGGTAGLPFDINGSLCVSADSQNDTVTLGQGMVRQDLVVDLGAGANSLSLGSANIHGDAFYTGGSGVDTVNLGTAVINGRAVLRTGDGNNIYQLNQLFTVGGDMFICAGNGNDVISSFAGTVGGSLSVDLGNGNNKLNLMSGTVLGPYVWYTGGSGVDQVTIGGVHNFSLIVHMGLGDDLFTYLAGATVGRHCLDFGPGIDSFQFTTITWPGSIFNLP